MPSLGKSLGKTLKKRSNFHQNQIRESKTREGENLQVFYIMNLLSLVAFENFEWLLMTPAVICNNCNFTKQYWSNILSNEFLGGNIWTLLAILSHVKCQWKVCYNKLKQGNFQKTDVGGETQDRARLHETWSELTPVWDFTSG